MLVQRHPHPIPLPSSPPPPDLPEYTYKPHISSPSAVQLKLNLSPKPSPLPTPGPPKAHVPTKPTFTLRRATINDASAIAHLGRTVFSKSFGFSIPPKDLNAYLTEAYTTEAIEDDLRCPERHVIVACARKPMFESSELETPSDGSETSTVATDEEDDNPEDDEDEDEILGFAQLTEGSTEPCLSHLDPNTLVELQRLYVSTAHHGLGIGQRLAREMDSLARELGYDSVFLGVWEGNFRAQRVYEALGFAKVGDHEFKMGRCIQMDWIMCKDL